MRGKRRQNSCISISSLILLVLRAQSLIAAFLGDKNHAERVLSTHLQVHGDFAVQLSSAYIVDASGTSFVRGPVTAPNPAAGKPVDTASLVNVPRLVTAYFANKPDPADPAQRVAFGTSGHRGSSLKNSFNENHILATTQAICDHRRETGLTGPLFVGIDTHALAEPALASAIEVFAANGVDIMIDERGGYTPTPVISHAILSYNKGRTSGLADGVVITPSHNPPEDGGYKYNPPHGGPADTDVTAKVEKAANAYLASRDERRGADAL